MVVDNLVHGAKLLNNAVQHEGKDVVIFLQKEAEKLSTNSEEVHSYILAIHKIQSIMNLVKNFTGME